MNQQEPNWSELIKEQIGSGKTIDDFCAIRGVNKYTFKKRKYGVKTKGELKPNDFIEISSRASTLSLKFKNGRMLEISGGFNEGEVRRLIGLLESC